MPLGFGKGAYLGPALREQGAHVTRVVRSLRAGRVGGCLHVLSTPDHEQTTCRTSGVSCLLNGLI